MSRIIILEGQRGSGKSTLASNIRQTVPETTLINPTGFHLDGQLGLDKIVEYYDNWFAFFQMNKGISNVTFVLDRFFFTEQVFSSLYKNYDFTDDYNYYMVNLHKLADRIDFVFMFADSSNIEERLNRDKVEFNNIKDDKFESLKQFNMYKEIYKDMTEKSVSNIFVHPFNTTGLEKDEMLIKGKEMLGLVCKWAKKL